MPQGVPTRKTNPEDVSNWIAANIRKIENLEQLGERPKPISEDASEPEQSLYEDADKEWVRRERARRHELNRLEQKAPTIACFNEFLHVKSKMANEDQFWKRRDSLLAKKVKDGASPGELAQRDDQRRMFAFFDAIYRECPDLAAYMRDDDVQKAHGKKSTRTNRTGNADAGPADAAPESTSELAPVGQGT